MRDWVPQLSVIVCTYNRGELLVQTLTSLVRQTLDKSRYEVIIVNNNSTDGTEIIARQFAENHSNFRTVCEKQQGLSHARNRGWKEACGTYIAFIDDDAKAATDWCERIIIAFQAVSPTPVAVGGEIHPFYETKPPKWFSDEFEIRTWGNQPGFLKPPRAKNGFSGSNMAFQKSILIDYGGFSAHYGMVGGRVRLGEDTELFNRIYREKPVFWYDPAIRVYHWVPKRNLRISYRLKRSFKAGEATCRMNNADITLYRRLRSLAGLFLFMFKVPFTISISKDRGKLLMQKLQELGYRVGFISGMFRNING